MYLPQQFASAKVVGGVWRVDFDIDNTHRWVRTIGFKQGPPRSRVQILYDNLFSPLDPTFNGNWNSIAYDHGERLLAAGSQLSLLWNLGTGLTPQAVMLCELADDYGTTM